MLVVMDTPSELQRPIPSSPLKVLVVTKEEALRKFETEICAGAGYEVLHARWGDQALDLYREHAPVTLIITDLLYEWTDWRMAMRNEGENVKNGLQLAVAVRRLHNQQRVVIQTYAALDHVTHFLVNDLAGVSLLHKPFRPEQLLALLKEEEVSKAG
jgi:DNA-binding response OmpR family regulator